MLLLHGRQFAGMEHDQDSQLVGDDEHSPQEGLSQVCTLISEVCCLTFFGNVMFWVVNAPVMQDRNDFDRKTEKNSSDLYFHYYGQLQHQQNMLQDYVRTGAYYSAIIENRSDFEGKIVMDVGAGSGILSHFAAQVSAQHSPETVPSVLCIPKRRKF